VKILTGSISGSALQWLVISSVYHLPCAGSRDVRENPQSVSWSEKMRQNRGFVSCYRRFLYRSFSSVQLFVLNIEYLLHALFSYTLLVVSTSVEIDCLTCLCRVEWDVTSVVHFEVNISSTKDGETCSFAATADLFLSVVCSFSMRNTSWHMETNRLCMTHNY